MEKKSHSRASRSADPCGGRGLHHNAQRDVGIKGQAPPGLNSCLALLQQIACSANLVQPRHQRKHDLDVMVRRTRPKQCAQLDLVQLRPVQAIADGPVTEERILLLGSIPR